MTWPDCQVRPQEPERSLPQFGPLGETAYQPHEGRKLPLREGRYPLERQECGFQDHDRIGHGLWQGIRPSGFPTGILNQTSVLLERSWITLMRQREFIRAQVVKNIIVAAVCGIIFWQQGRGIPADPSRYPTAESFNIASLWYFAMLYTILSNLQIIPQLFFFRVSTEASCMPLEVLVEVWCVWLAGDLHKGEKRACESTGLQTHLVPLC
jgi:hypothetical protein